MKRFFKYGAVTLLAVFFGAFLLFGSNVTSMIRTASKSIQRKAQQAIPVEFELERAKEKIRDILPDLQSQVQMIAEEEVAIANLEKEVQSDEARLESLQNSLTGIRNQMRTTQVSYEISGRDFNRQQITEHLSSRFNHFKQAQLSLESKRKLLDKRTASLNAALAMLDQMRTRQSELELKVETLAAEHRLIKANQIESGRLIDSSQLSQADQLLTHLEDRLAVASRVLDYQDDVFASPEPTAVAETDVLADFDNYFAPPKTELAGKIASAGR